MAKRRRIVQMHHITYTPEWKVPIYKGEHMILTHMQWMCRKSVSKGFLTALRHFVKEWAKKADDLEKDMTSCVK